MRSEIIDEVLAGKLDAETALEEVMISDFQDLAAIINQVDMGHKCGYTVEQVNKCLFDLGIANKSGEFFTQEQMNSNQATFSDMLFDFLG